MLLIATTNKNKFNRLKKVIEYTFPNIKIAHIFDKKITPPVENRNDELKNVLIKAKFYYSQLQINVFVEDNGIYFYNIEPNKQLAANFKDYSYGLSPKKLFKKISFFLKNNEIHKGYLKYVFALACNKRTYTKCIDVPFLISSDVKFISDTNILNNFILPRGFNIPISQMTKKELERYRDKYISNSIKELIEPHINDLV